MSTFFCASTAKKFLTFRSKIFSVTVLDSRYVERERVREKINSNNKERKKNVKITVNYREEEKKNASWQQAHQLVLKNGMWCEVKRRRERVGEMRRRKSVTNIDDATFIRGNLHKSRVCSMAVSRNAECSTPLTISISLATRIFHISIIKKEFCEYNVSRGGM